MERMKAFLVFLMICVGLSSCKYSNLKLPWLLRESVGMPNQIGENAESMKHAVYRRQASECDVNDVIISSACQMGSWQEVVNIILSCGDNEAAKSSARVCDINSDGEYCGINQNDDMISNARIQCSSNSESCPMECANALQALQDNFGCCINSNFNTSDSTDRIFNNTLWSQCGVETVGECESTITVNIPMSNTFECTEEELNDRIVRFQCTSIFDAILDVEGCKSDANGFIDICRFNSQQEFCSLTTDVSQQLDPILAQCTANQQSCSGGCRTALETLRNDLGCCVNLLYNGTGNSNPDQAFATSYGLWKQCNVKTPPETCLSLLGGNSQDVTTKDSSNNCIKTQISIFSVFVFLLAAVVVGNM